MTDSNVAFGLLTSLVPLVVMLVLIIVPVALFIWAVKKPSSDLHIGVEKSPDDLWIDGGGR